MRRARNYEAYSMMPEWVWAALVFLVAVIFCWAGYDFGHDAGKLKIWKRAEELQLGHVRTYYIGGRCSRTFDWNSEFGPGKEPPRPFPARPAQ